MHVQGVEEDVDDEEMLRQVYLGPTLTAIPTEDLNLSALSDVLEEMERSVLEAFNNSEIIPHPPNLRPAVNQPVIAPSTPSLPT